MRAVGRLQGVGVVEQSATGNPGDEQPSELFSGLLGCSLWRSGDVGVV